MWQCTHITLTMYTHYCDNVHTSLWQSTDFNVTMHTHYHDNVHTLLWQCTHTNVTMYTHYWDKVHTFQWQCTHIFEIMSRLYCGNIHTSLWQCTHYCGNVHNLLSQCTCITVTIVTLHIISVTCSKHTMWHSIPCHGNLDLQTVDNFVRGHLSIIVHNFPHPQIHIHNYNTYNF